MIAYYSTLELYLLKEFFDAGFLFFSIVLESIVKYTKSCLGASEPTRDQEEALTEVVRVPQPSMKLRRFWVEQLLCCHW